MPYLEFIWDLPDDPDGNVQHIAEHDVEMEEVEQILTNPSGYDVSHSSGRPLAFGRTSTGRLLYVIYDEVDDGVVYPITAYEIEE